MPIYKLTKADRCKILNITPEVHDLAQMLIAERWNEKAGAAMDAEDPAAHLSWYDACRIVDPNTNHGRYSFIVDNGHCDRGDWWTIALNKHTAALLRKDLGVELEWFHETHHRPEDIIA